MGKKKLSKKQEAESYTKKRVAMTERSREVVATGQDIGSPPPIANPKLRESCRMDFLRFLTTYESVKTYFLPFSDTHRLIISTLESIIFKGGQSAFAGPRGLGKTSFAESASRWALLYGHRKWAVIIAESEKAASDILESFLKEFEVNELLAADFPEVCHPFCSLNGSAGLCKGQQMSGRRTKMKITATEFIFPESADSPSSGARVSCVGITGRIRGLRARGPLGESFRPDLVIADDISKDATDETARRMRIMDKAVLGLAGPGKRIACMMPCTVIERGDIADQLTDRDLHPEWRGIRVKALESMPDRMDLWDKWFEIDRGCMEGDDHEPAHQYVRDNYDAMHAGVIHYWMDRIDEGDASAVESSMRVYYYRREAFFCELQNSPEADELAALLDAKQIMQRISGLPRGMVPEAATHLTFSIDCHANMLYFAVVAWEAETFSGWVVNYGAYPDQKRRYWKQNDAPYPLGVEAARQGYASAEGSLQYGIHQALKAVLVRYPMTGGGTMAVSGGLVDAGWMTDTVYDALTSTAFSTVLPSFGRAIRATQNQLNVTTRKKRRGEIRGRQWYTRSSVGKARHCVFDSNHWKTFIRDRLITPVGEPGALVLFGDDPQSHDMFAAHCMAEAPKAAQYDSRTVEEWADLPGGIDNHLWDNLIMSAVAASIGGVCLAGEAAQLANPSPQNQGPPPSSAAATSKVQNDFGRV